jgi:hypothetical protein
LEQVEGRSASDYTHDFRKIEWDCSIVYEPVKISCLLEATVGRRDIIAAIGNFSDPAGKINLGKRM